MANVVENLGKLERRVTISLPKDTVQKEVDSRIRQLAKNVRMPGFRRARCRLRW
jgi:trigger factor